MREILFRGKTEKGKWIEGDLYQSRLKSIFMISRYTEHGNRMTEVVSPETVGQYTGLLDKDGKKVFEGDIVKVYDNFDYVGETLYVGKVQWDDTFLNWELKTSEKTVWQLKNLPSVLYYEVIGNVFDNPELLEVK